MKNGNFESKAEYDQVVSLKLEEIGTKVRALIKSYGTESRPGLYHEYEIARDELHATIVEGNRQFGT